MIRALQRVPWPVVLAACFVHCTSDGQVDDGEVVGDGGQGDAGAALDAGELPDSGVATDGGNPYWVDWGHCVEARGGIVVQECATDADCAFRNGAYLSYSCLDDPQLGFKTCIETGGCASDADCTADAGESCVPVAFSNNLKCVASCATPFEVCGSAGFSGQMLCLDLSSGNECHVDGCTSNTECGSFLPGAECVSDEGDGPSICAIRCAYPSR